jgi:hypothetical protein
MPKARLIEYDPRPIGEALMAERGMELTREDLLILLVEECGEVIQAATKCLRFGFDVDHGVGYGLNSQVLSKECGDLQAVMDALPLNALAKMQSQECKITRAQIAKGKYGRPSPRGGE